MNNVSQLHESYENCPMWLLTYTDDDGTLDCIQFHDELELQRYIDNYSLMYYTIERLY